jgi:hypothetical protein
MILSLFQLLAETDANDRFLHGSGYDCDPSEHLHVHQSYSGSETSRLPFLSQRVLN